MSTSSSLPPQLRRRWCLQAHLLLQQVPSFTFLRPTSNPPHLQHVRWPFLVSGSQRSQSTKQRDGVSDTVRSGWLAACPRIEPWDRVAKRWRNNAPACVGDGAPRSADRCGEPLGPGPQPGPPPTRPRDLVPVWRCLRGARPLRSAQKKRQPRGTGLAECAQSGRDKSSPGLRLRYPSPTSCSPHSPSPTFSSSSSAREQYTPASSSGRQRRFCGALQHIS